MKVITLDNIKKFIEDKHDKPQMVKKYNDIGLVVIQDEGSAETKVIVNVDGVINISGNIDCVHCVLTDKVLNDFNSEHPFIKKMEVFEGALIVDGVTPSENEIGKYFYTI